jgi:6,7-dimethyl-8-ribityllumazine synthase
MNIAIVISQFNKSITQALLDGAIWQLTQDGVKKSDLQIYWVPGAVEIPLLAKKCAASGRYQAIICLGAVIRGDTPHFDYVCQQVSQGCMQVSLDHEDPVIFGVLTTNNWRQAEERIGGRHGHKGKEAARTALDMIKLIENFHA